MSDALEQVVVTREGCIDFISDLHLQASETATFQAWSNYILSTPAKTVFILGDFFEVWAGDDVAQSAAGAFERECLHILSQAASTRDIYFMAGNRDFLLQSAALSQAHMRELRDPCSLHAQGMNVVLSHGDEMCLSDTEYLKFRSMVRDKRWQAQFLSQPLEQRLATARAMREKSEQEKSKYRSAYQAANALSASSQDPKTDHSPNEDAVMGLHDVDAQAACKVLDTFKSDTLIHGHTHRPGLYPLPGSKRRWVLSDWDAKSNPQRLEVLRMQDGRLERIPL
jgi:UDP-2,3-diacylglucosamine hydrolase